MSDPVDTTPFTIIPLEGGVGEISLVATALPFAGVAFATEQRVKTTYYPGNPVATQTVIGPTKPNTTVSGRWMDMSLGDGAARLLVRDIEYLCERGIPVEVRWGGVPTSRGFDPPVVRRGVIRRFEPKYQRSVNVEWSIEFEWRGEALQTTPLTFAASLRPSNDMVDFEDDLETVHDQGESWRETAWSLLGKGADSMLVVSDAIDQVQNAVVDATGVVNGASELLQQATELPSSVVDRLCGICESIVLTLWNARAALDSAVGLWAGLSTLPRDGAVWREASVLFAQQAKRAQIAFLPTDDPLDRLDQATTNYAIVQGWDSLAEKSFRIGAEYAAKRVPEIIAVLRPSAGSDLRDIAAKPEIYGNPDLWYVIADYNGLDSSEVPAAPTGPSEWEAPPIYVPRLNPESAALVWREP